MSKIADKIMRHYLKQVAPKPEGIEPAGKGWQHRTFLLSDEQAKIVDLALGLIIDQLEGENLPGRALELMAADFISNG